MSGLRFDMSEEISNVKITNKNEVFQDTDFADTPFSVTVQPITKLGYSKLKKDASKGSRGLSICNDAELDIGIFKKCVVGWDGLNDLDNKPIPYNADMVKLIADKHWQFASKIIIAILEINQIKTEHEALASGN